MKPFNCKTVHSSKGGSSPPFFKAPTISPSLHSIFKSFLFHPLLNYFRQFLPLSCKKTPPAIRHTNLPYKYTQVHFLELKLRINFFIKLCWQKKIIVLQLYNTILQRAKKFLNVNLINLENIK